MGRECEWGGKGRGKYVRGECVGGRGVCPLYVHLYEVMYSM